MAAGIEVYKKANQKTLEQVQEQRLKQLKGYAESKDFAGKKDLKKALIKFIGKDQYLMTEVFPEEE